MTDPVERHPILIVIVLGQAIWGLVGVLLAVFLGSFIGVGIAVLASISIVRMPRAGERYFSVTGTQLVYWTMYLDDMIAMKVVART